MSDEETTANNAMDVDITANESSSPAPEPSSTVLDIGNNDGDISDLDDENISRSIPSQSSTPDSVTLPTTVSKKPLATNKPSLTKNKSVLVSYDYVSDDDEPRDEEESEDSNGKQDTEDNRSNSSSAVLLHPAGESDMTQGEINIHNDPTIVTSDLLNVTPFKSEEASPSHLAELTSNYPFIFPEDAEIRIPSQPAKSCSAKLEKKFEEYYKRFKKTGIDQNVRIQELKDFRNPSMYEKMISHLNIDEIGTNFPRDLYDPHWWGKESYYEELSKAQKLEMDRREKERRERTKIGFTPGVKKVDQVGSTSSTNPDIAGEKRKTRFDQ